jgi:hypothetical protein
MEIASWQLAGAIEAVRGSVPIENLASDALAKRLLGAIQRGHGTDVVDAHICCEHVPDDLELSVMADIVRLMGRVGIEPYAVVRALYPLDGQQLYRVSRWFISRYPGPPGGLPD